MRTKIHEMHVETLLRFCLFIATLDKTLSSECTSNVFCRIESIMFPEIHQRSYFSAKRFNSTFLNVISFEKSMVNNEYHCMKKCISSKQCLSMNLISNLESNKNLLECQLLNRQAYTDKYLLVQQQSSTHLTAIHLGCEKALCKNNATCLPNYANDTSSCKCSSKKFGGTFCEKEQKVVSLKYNKEFIRNKVDIESMMKDSFYQKVLQNATCLFDFKDSITSGSNGHIFAYFIPPVTGIYKFTLYCSDSENCRLYISTHGKQDRRILINKRDTSFEVYLEQDIKKFLEVLATVRDCVLNVECYTNNISVAVHLPDGTLSNPISNKYLASIF
ncbi:uncharacterized protein LOC105850977 isoform X2 [Hydra vulgaris]|uniref:uncharacterized protein LOC105850977 isoform X2 n=1 Tax=Hydra vulgaris TaxID=6087 RepID=UPI001F5F5494|nr:uncharacterized protein LOC105850977 isoform X2 [Hydra vulgaris]